MIASASATRLTAGTELRAADASDAEFLRRVYASTREAEMGLLDWPEAAKAHFLRQQFDAQDAHYRAHYPGASLDVILQNGERVGRLFVHRSKTEIRVMDIALIADARGRGIGTGLMTELLDEGADTDRPVTIHVEAHNPARAWYERLGFRAIEARGPYLFMAWTPGSSR